MHETPTANQDASGAGAAMASPRDVSPPARRRNSLRDDYAPVETDVAGRPTQKTGGCGIQVSVGWDDFFSDGFLDGGLEHFLFSPILGTIIPTDSYFSEELKPPTRFI